MAELRPRLVAAGACASAWLAVAEIGLLRARHPVAAGDVAILLIAALALTALLVGALGLALAPLLSWRRAVRLQAAVHARPPLRFGLGALCLAGAAGAHWINATAYVRLYTSIHMALSIATALAAYVGFAVLLPLRAPGRNRRRWWLVGAALLAWVAALGGSLAAIVRSHGLRFVAVEQTTMLWHELWAFDAITGVLEPVDAADGAAVPDELLAPLRAASPPAPSGLARGANVVLITVDSLRTDRLGPELPAIEALRAEAVELERAYSPGCATVHAVTATLTSHYPSQLDFTFVTVDRDYRFTPHARDSELVTNPLHARKVHEVPLHEQRPTLAGLLGAGGYQTATIAAYIYYFRGAGVVRDFEIVDEEAYRALSIDSMGIAPIDMVGRAEKFLAERDPARPFFLWMHFMEPHAPYTARDEAARGAGAEARYDSELRFVDRQLARLLPQLPDDTIVALHADHGEEFGDHGGDFHGTSCYDEVVRVPLLLRVPGLAARRIAMPVGLVDLAPTVLDLVGVATDAPLMGRSLVPLLSGDRVIARPVLVECMPPGRLVRALIAWPFKLIVDRELGTFQLYDLSRDPAELRNLADRDAVAFEELRALLRAIEQRVLDRGQPP